MAEAHWNGGTCCRGQKQVIWGSWGVWGQPDWGFAGLMWMQKWYINGIVILYANIFFTGFYVTSVAFNAFFLLLFFTRFYVGSLNKSSVIPGTVIFVCLCLQTCFLNRWWTYIKIQQGYQIDKSLWTSAAITKCKLQVQPFHQINWAVIVILTCGWIKPLSLVAVSLE